jgi:dephospho-CoA kinase
MLTIGITGGIGSGKTTVCKVFKTLGIPVFQADLVARRLQDEDTEIKMELIRLFGEETYTPNGLLNRKRLAEIVFNNESYLKQVNQLIHPAVRAAFNLWKEKNAQFPYVLYEAAILFETGSSHNFDFTILVVADEKERIDRVMKRDMSSVESILNRMRNQMSDREKIKLADFIIENNDNQLIIPEILKLDQIFKSNNHVRKINR